MNYLLDTCVISELIAKRPKQTVLNCLNAQVPSDLYLSVITIGELTKFWEAPPTLKCKIFWSYGKFPEFLVKDE